MNRLASIALLLILLSGLILPLIVEPVIAVYHPRNYGEAYSVGFSGIIEPTNPTVLKKINELCPVTDEQHFTVNLKAVYNSAMLIPYAYDSTVYGVPDYWQTSEETILLNRGDCEDQAINLATQIEALYQQTYGYIPINLVWVVIGHVQTSNGGGGHGWVLLNEGLLPEETVQQIQSTPISESITNIIIGGVAEVADLISETTTTLDLSLLGDKNGISLSILYLGERYFELEPTWNLPISEFHNKEYPYTEVWAIFNSQKVEYNPTFYPTTKPIFTGAEIKNIAFDNEIVAGNSFTINVTVQNYECGIIGADLIVILKNNGVELTKQTAFIYRYFWQMHTFVFTVITSQGNIGQMNLSSELYFKDWNNQVYIRDSKNFTIQVVDGNPPPSPSPTPTPTQTPVPSPTLNPTPTPSPTASPLPTSSLSPTPLPTPTTTPTTTPTPSPAPTPTATPTPTVTPTPSPSPTESPTPTPTPTINPTITPTPTQSLTTHTTSNPTTNPTIEPTTQPTSTNTPTPSQSPSTPIPQPVEPTATSTTSATPSGVNENSGSFVTKEALILAIIGSIIVILALTLLFVKRRAQ